MIPTNMKKAAVFSVMLLSADIVLGATASLRGLCSGKEGEDDPNIASDKVGSKGVANQSNEAQEEKVSDSLIASDKVGDKDVANPSHKALLEDASDSLKDLRQRVGKGYALQPILEFFTPQQMMMKAQLLKKKVYKEIIPGIWPDPVEVCTMNTQFNHQIMVPNALVVDRNRESPRYGHIYVSASNQNSILHITPQGVESHLPVETNSPIVLTADPKGNLYVGNSTGGLTAGLEMITFEEGIANLPLPSVPNGIRKAQFDRNGNMFVLSDEETICKISKIQNGISIVLATFENVEKRFPYVPVRGVAVDRDGKYIYLMDTMDRKIRQLDVSEHAGISYQKIPALKDEDGNEIKFSFPQGITVDALGNLYVIDYSEEIHPIIFRLSREKEDGEVFWVKSKFAESKEGYKDGPRLEAEFGSVRVITNDSYITSSGELSGILYILDTEYNCNTMQIISRIRMIPLSHDAVGRVEKLSRRQTEKN